jgi:hypothetical protein
MYSRDIVLIIQLSHLPPRLINQIVGSKLINGYTGVLSALYLPTLMGHFKFAVGRTHYISSMWVV